MAKYTKSHPSNEVVIDGKHEYAQGEKESYSGIFTLLIIPLTIFLLGWGALNLFDGLTNQKSNTPANEYGIGGGPATISPSPRYPGINAPQYGIGGGPQMTISPSSRPHIQDGIPGGW